MKQTKVNLPSGTYWVMKLPTGATHAGQVHIYAGEDPITFHNKEGEIVSAISLPGNWQLLGADPTRLTEVEAGEIVEIVGYGNSIRYKNYLCKSILPSTQWGHGFDTTPTASLDSLAESLGISKPYVILKNVEK